MGEHEKAGYGARDIGYGSKPAILVVDFQRAFTDPSFELGRFEHVHKAVEKTASLLKAARELGVPVAKCYTAYESERDVLNWKVDVLHREFFHGHPCTELDSRIHDPGYDYSFCKMSASIFFNTPVTAYLTKHSVDTVIITGCTTSGCIRASVVDSFSYGYRTIVAEDCSGDGEEQAHRNNIQDMGRRYADIKQSQEVIDYLYAAPGA